MIISDFFSFKGKLSVKKFWIYMLILLGVEFLFNAIISCVYARNVLYFYIIPNILYFDIIPDIKILSWWKWRWAFHSFIYFFKILFEVICFVFYVNLLRRRIADIGVKSKKVVTGLLVVLVLKVYFINLYHIYDFEYYLVNILVYITKIILNMLVVCIGFMKSDSEPMTDDESDNNRVFAITFKGRATRVKMWKACAICWSIILVWVLLFSLRYHIDFDYFDWFVRGDIGKYFYEYIIYFTLPIVFYILFFIPLVVRRLHDLGMSGWWYYGISLLGTIPFVGVLARLVMFVLLYCIDGNPYPNKYGRDPKRRSDRITSMKSPNVSETSQIDHRDDIDKFEERLNTLIKLKEKGLITEEEYQMKRSEFISKL